jgi:tRNA nucleotidyltransferase (CCA-adding enzyme)
MEIITGHVNTDFDSLASMVAARKLYPQAYMVFPGSVNRNVREYIALHGDMFDFMDLRSLDLDTVTRLIVVDTRQADRLGELEPLARQKDLEVFIFDHHPPNRNDIRSSHDMSEEVGATVTVLLKLLRSKEIPIESYEATLFALGIHEDTGSLTYAGATAEDAEALAYLMRMGAKPAAVTLYLNRTLSPAQHDLVNRLLQGFKYHDIRGIRVVLSAVEVEGFVEGASAAVSRIMELENLDVFFALVRQGDRVNIMGHSRMPSVRVDRVLAELGGGGHAEAATAVLRKHDLHEAENLLLQALGKKIRVQLNAKKIMTPRVRTVSEDATIAETSKRMERTGHTAFPVVDADGRLVGMISRKDLDRAGHHGLGHAPVKGFMSRNVITVDADAPVQQLHSLMTENAIGRLPVVEKGRIVGIITRKDLLRAMQGMEYLRRGHDTHPATEEHLAELIRRSLPQVALKVIEHASGLADSFDYKVYLVGGMVRDLLLGERNLDLDLVVEGKGIEFARRLAASMGGRVRSHRKFGTATVILPDGLHVDVATARTEYYPFPAALPQVEEASIRQDLYRRDFSINAMAISLHPESFGELLDYFGGRRDLERRQIRVLHNLSFVEDPTRIFRAVRLEVRYGFAMEQQTEALARRAVEMEFVGELSGARIREELVDILGERHPLDAVRRLHELGALTKLYGKLSFDQDMEKRFKRLERQLPRFHKISLADDEEGGEGEGHFQNWTPYMAALLEGLDREEVVAWSLRMRLKRKDASRIFDCLEWKERANRLKRFADSPGKAHLVIRTLSREGIAYLYAQGGSAVRSCLELYYTRKRMYPLRINGKDLESLGLPPSPLFADILTEVARASLDGEATSRRSQLALARKLCPEREGTGKKLERGR